LRMNWTMRIASSMAAYCGCVPSNLYSNISTGTSFQTDDGEAVEAIASFLSE
jgi:hypothetical protein